ncbi:MAG TPA: hypothetical protein PLF90_00450 [bacterium]|nr:hypothetical protein [bacterium]
MLVLSITLSPPPETFGYWFAVFHGIGYTILIFAIIVYLNKFRRRNK